MRSELPVCVEQQRHRAVGDELDFHLGTKAPSRDVHALRARRRDQGVENRLGQQPGRGTPKGGAQPFAEVAEQGELRHQGEASPDVQQTPIHATLGVGKDADSRQLCRQGPGALRVVVPTDRNQGEQSPLDLPDPRARYADFGAPDALHHAAHSQTLGAILRRKAPAVDGATFGAHQHDLAQPHALRELERVARHVADLQHLAVLDAGLDEGRSHVNHQAKPGEAASTLEESAQVVGKTDLFHRDAVDRATGFQNVGLFEGVRRGVVAKVGFVADRNRRRAGLDHTDLAPEGEVDRSGTDLSGVEGVDDETTPLELAENCVSCQNHARRIPEAMKHPFLRVPSPCVLGHRGAAGECPENTLTSFERALARGASILETDLRISRDGVAVMFHDATVDRTTEGSGRVADHALAELRRLDAGYRFSPPEAERASTPYRGRGVRIPTLEEALATFPSARFNLELKDGDPRLVEAVLETIASAGAADRVLLTAGADAIMARLRERVEAAEAGVALGACTGEIGSFVKSAIAGVAPPERLDVLQVPARFRGVPLVTPYFVGHAHRHDLIVHVWTVNDQREMQALLRLGVDGLITDFPARALEQISQRE